MNQASFDQAAYATLMPVWQLHSGTSTGEIKAVLSGMEVGNAILFLASDQAKGINGIRYVISGEFFSMMARFGGKVPAELTQ